jgi:hypothetical protein
MPDHWPYVVAAYAIAAALVLGYWRYLERRARTAAAPPRRRRA